MAKDRRPAVDYAVYLAVRSAVALLQALPFAVGRSIARGLAALAHRFDRRHTEVARDNLRHAFPDWSPRRIDRAVAAVYRHFLTLVVEIARLPRGLHVTNWRRTMTLVNAQPLLDCLTSGRPLLIVTGHFGNWELAGFALGLLGFRTFAVARALDNPYLDDFFRRRFREKTGQTVLDKNADYDKLLAALAGGRAVATLADQDAGHRGLFVEFFGRPASTFKSIALLALEYRASLAVLGVPKLDDGRYAVVVEDVIGMDEYDGRPDAVKAVTQRYTTALERLVRRHPEQYFWLHRRWKHQPAARKTRAA